MAALRAIVGNVDDGIFHLGEVFDRIAIGKGQCLGINENGEYFTERDAEFIQFTDETKETFYDSLGRFYGDIEYYLGDVSVDELQKYITTGIADTEIPWKEYQKSKYLQETLDMFLRYCDDYSYRLKSDVKTKTLIIVWDPKEVR